MATKKSKTGGSKGKAVATKKTAVKNPAVKTRASKKSTRGGVREGAGRPQGPWKFKTVAELQAKIQAYFDDCNPHWEWVGIYHEKRNSKGLLIVKDGRVQYDEIKVMRETKQKDYTVNGLCLWLDTSRETLLDYESGKYDLPVAKGKEKAFDFSDTIKRAKLAIENYAERKLFGPNATGVIFNLKNNWGWKDVFENKNTNHEVKFVNDVPRPNNS